jgi:hypothetical protein
MVGQSNFTAKYRAWCFTLNNYTQADEDHIKNILTGFARYVVYGREIAPTTGTPHLQGYVYFHNARQHRAVTRLLPHAVVQPANGTTKQNYTYCTKDGDFFEHGDMPIEKTEARLRGGMANAARYANAVELARKGDMDAIRESDPQMFLVHGPRLESLYAPEARPLEGDLQHEWWVGPSGTGKSRLLWELYPKHFAKALNKWWDGYRHQDVVAIEEWSPKNDLTASSLKKWADRYPFPGEIKGGCLQGLRPKKIIVLSNYTPQQCFLNQEDLEPILRRFTVMYFPKEEQHARFRAADFCIPINTIMDCVIPETSDEDEFELPDLDLDALMEDL